MLDLLLALLAAGRVFFRSRTDAALEVLALRQQVAVLKRKHPRPAVNRMDRVLWIWLRRVWPRWKDALVIVKPETVIGWHRAGFRLYWRWRSQPHCGRPRVAEEVRTVIRRMAQENADLGAPKIHGELLKLGFVVSERTVARYLRRLRRRGDPDRRWLTFLADHCEAIVAMDFFTVPTLTFQLLYCFFVIEHERRRILHFNVTSTPTSERVVQQLREAFFEAGQYRYVILDRDSKFDADVIQFLKSTGLTPKRISVQAPWQNGLAEHWIGSCRRELLDHVIALNESDLRRLIREYVSYHHKDRIHDSLEKETPIHRAIERKPNSSATVIAMPGSEGFIIGIAGARRRRTRVLLNGSTADLAEALESQFHQKSRRHTRWRPDLMPAVPSHTNPEPASTNRRNQVWGPWKSLSLPLYIVCGCHPVLSTDNSFCRPWTCPDAPNIVEYGLIFTERNREYILTTRWSVPGRLDQVAAIFKDVEAFPRWWRPVFLKAVILEQGGDNGKGRVAALTTRGFLPYILRWRIRIVDAHEPFGFDFCASGDLVGLGEWTFRQVEEYVDVELHWTVAIDKVVLKHLSRVLKPLFVWNHRWAMARGRRGLQNEIRRRSMI